jgi:hypothetical protein
MKRTWQGKSRFDRRERCVDERVQAVGYAQGILHDSSVRGEASLALHLHQVGQKTFTSKLLSMPSARLSRFAAVACCRV